MTTMNVSLPDAMKAFVDEQIAKGGYSSASEYVRELIRQAQKRAAQERLEALLLEGLESGEPVPVTPEFWEQRRKELRKRLNRANKAKKKPSDRPRPHTTSGPSRHRRDRRVPRAGQP